MQQGKSDGLYTSTHQQRPSKVTRLLTCLDHPVKISRHKSQPTGRIKCLACQEQWNTWRLQGSHGARQTLYLLALLKLLKNESVVD